MTHDRNSDWSQTFTGRKAFAMDPRAEDVCLEDIAHSLALQCRFGGHCREPYSVAEHSVRVALYVQEKASLLNPTEWAFDAPRRLTLAALLHDASEAYLTDIIRPVKSHPRMRPYCEAERVMQAIINEWAGLPADAHKGRLVHEADEVLLATEARDLMSEPPDPWCLSHDPMPDVIVPWDWRKAETEFLAMFYELRTK